jgi:hypothetical protein
MHHSPPPFSLHGLSRSPSPSPHPSPWTPAILDPPRTVRRVPSIPSNLRSSSPSICDPCRVPSTSLRSSSPDLAPFRNDPCRASSSSLRSSSPSFSPVRIDRSPMVAPARTTPIPYPVDDRYRSQRSSLSGRPPLPYLAHTVAYQSNVLMSPPRTCSSTAIAPAQDCYVTNWSNPNAQESYVTNWGLRPRRDVSVTDYVEYVCCISPFEFPQLSSLKSNTFQIITSYMFSNFVNIFC